MCEHSNTPELSLSYFKICLAWYDIRSWGRFKFCGKTKIADRENVDFIFNFDFTLTKTTQADAPSKSNGNWLFVCLSTTNSNGDIALRRRIGLKVISLLNLSFDWQDFLNNFYIIPLATLNTTLFSKMISVWNWRSYRENTLI